MTSKTIIVELNKGKRQFKDREKSGDIKLI